jgi:2-oxoglutarate dehydrogenase E2 component (dihydrolipoamide succinyltransferase)
MKKNIVAPSVGESITEVSILKWHKKSGQAVKTGELLLEIESDKATVEIVAENNGVLQIGKPDGTRIPIGDVIGFIDDAATATVAASAPTAAAPAASAPKAVAPAPAAAPSGVAMTAAPARAAAPASAGMGPAARKIATEQGVDTTQLAGSGRDGRVTKGDVLQAAAAPSRTTGAATPTSAPAPTSSSAPVSSYQERPGDRRVPMSMLRQRIAQRLVEAQHTAAILTTFNEVDMGPIMEIRAKNKDAFKAKHGVNLGFMGFFAKACIEAFKTVPEVNASLDMIGSGRGDVIYRDYCDLGIAVGTDRGLVVPVLREAHTMNNIAIEKRIGELALKARDGKLSIADLTGGTFTITNGGTYGSLMSTPILNPPQSGILGMHKIQDRPMAVMDEKGGKVVIRPMMYLALSYDHRLIDGKGAVTFLVTVKDLLEHPEKLGMEY